MFGHERGAFTGAPARSGPAVSSWRISSLFLDEVGDACRWAAT
ncbi:sigma 54-interacting transcriptional regulator [Salmonella enterica subsp. enterica]|nr:sigma 54-interacting transcriptional regulator [Salmonella enterica subsp. enterica]